MTTAALIWVTARDGGIHATRPPIIASGHPTLCDRWYDRLDLRIKAQPDLADCHPIGACPGCCDAAGIVRSVEVPAKRR